MRASGSVLSLALAGLVCAQAGSPEEATRTIFAAKCLSCHGQARMSDLDLRDLSTILKGGKRGPAAVPGNAEASLIYKAVRREGELQMPPGNTPLSSSEIAAVRDWINAGAHWESGASASAASWWSFRKPVRPPVPAAKRRSWVRNSIDAFILSELEQNGLEPSAPADRRSLVRRAYFDLHGLPPTPEESDQFVNDPSPDAYTKLIERLLSSPRYGERWGRYWLDLVRYADTSGFETDHFYTTAWRYRDYVIASFNQDKPYDTFVKEQIAADELWSTSMDLEGTLKLPKEKQENVNRRVGTSLFTLGAFPIEYTYYGDQYRAEWQAEAVDVVGSAFLGLTLGCARCHDHKFDPITQRDYYRMCALFAGSVEREIPLVSLFDIQTNSRNFPLLAQAQALKRIAGASGRGRRREQADQEGGAPPERASATDPKRAALLQQLGEAYLRAPERYPTANVLAHEEVVPETHILLRGDFKRKGEEVTPGFPGVLNPGPPIQEPNDVLFVPRRRKALALWLTAPISPCSRGSW